MDTVPGFLKSWVYLFISFRFRKEIISCSRLKVKKRTNRLGLGLVEDGHEGVSVAGVILAVLRGGDGEGLESHVGVETDVLEVGDLGLLPEGLPRLMLALQDTDGGEVAVGQDGTFFQNVKW